MMLSRRRDSLVSKKGRVGSALVDLPGQIRYGRLLRMWEPPRA